LELLANLVGWLMPACITFGPLFLVIEGKTPKYTRILRVVGVVMVTLALMTSWIVLEDQRRDLEPPSSPRYP
jgi:hypothetical protein